MVMCASSRDVFDAVVVAPGFALGVCCEANLHVTDIEFLEPRQPLIPPGGSLAGEVASQLAKWLKHADFMFDLPLKTQGTPFQRQVWAQISAIPLGQTRTYGDLAKALKSAPRPVGGACGANPFPVVVPCHRVVAAGGGLGGFNRAREGFLLDVKRWLLDHEAGR